MHPVIAALTFIFSPSDDWLLKKAYELVLEPVQVPATVNSYDQLAKRYPSLTETSAGTVRSADVPAMVIWSEMLQEQGHFEEAQNLRVSLLKHPMLAQNLSDDLKIRLGEMALLDRKVEEAEKYFSEALTHQGPRALEAATNMLIVSLAKSNRVESQKWADEVKRILGDSIETSRAVFPLGLEAYARQSYDEAATIFAMTEDDPKAGYFLALSYRHNKKPVDALAQLNKIRQNHPNTEWAELANYQVAETYYAMGDEMLTKAACEKAIALNPKSAKEFVFRLAAIEMMHGNYEGALARLKETPMEGDLAERANVVVAEALIKTGQAGKMVKAIAKKLPKNATPISVYQTAWANAFDMEFDKSFMIAETGLNDFYDPEVTPRLLLLEAMAYEHLNLQADALATYQTLIDRFPTTIAAAQGTEWLMRSYMRLGRYREAVTHGVIAWNSLSPIAKMQRPEAAFWMAEAHTKMNRFEDAAKNYSEYLSMATPKSNLYPYAQFEQAMTLAKLGETKGALAQLDQFAKTSNDLKKPEWVELAQIQKGNILFNDRNFENAVLAYRSAPNSPKAMYYEGLALNKMDYFTDSIDTWQKLVSTFPASSYAEMASFKTGRTLFELGRATDAVTAFAFYMEKYPESPRVKEALLQSAHALYNTQDFAAAAPLYTQYLSKYREVDDLVSVTPYLAACAVKSGKSLDEIEVALQGLPPADVLASLRWESGAKDFNEKKFPEANLLFARLLADFPTDTNSQEAMFFRAESLFNAQAWLDAEGAYNNYLNMNPAMADAHSPVALFHKGVAIYQQGNLMKAAKTFETFVQTHPNDKLSDEAKNNMLIAYHNMGDWTTRDLMKQKYGEPAVATNAPAPEATQESSQPAAEEQGPQNSVAQADKRPYLVEEKDKLNHMRMETQPESLADAQTAPVDQ